MKALVENGEIFVASHIEMIADELLLDRKGNAKKHPPEQLARLAGGIREYGFVVPLLIDDKERLIAGHGRRIAGRSVGMTSFPCVRASHLTEGQIRALVLFDNKIAETGFDPSLLKLELEGLADLDEELLGVTGFDPEELNRILNGLEGGNEDGEGKKTTEPPTLKFGAHKIQMSEAEAQALDGLAEMHLSKHKDLVGFVENTLLKIHR